MGTEKYNIDGATAAEFTLNYFKTIAEKYKQDTMLKIVEAKNELMMKSDVFTSLSNIVQAVIFTEGPEAPQLEGLKKSDTLETYQSDNYHILYNLMEFKYHK